MIFALAIGGLAISGYILRSKITNEKLVCFIGDDCNKVVKSKYGYLFRGLPNEFFGAIYYLAVIGAVILGLEKTLLFQVPAGLAFLASLYLAGIQVRILKEWCEFCLTTALINAVIFLMVVFRI